MIQRDSCQRRYILGLVYLYLSLCSPICYVLCWMVHSSIGGILFSLLDPPIYTIEEVLKEKLLNDVQHNRSVLLALIYQFHLLYTILDSYKQDTIYEGDKRLCSVCSILPLYKQQFTQRKHKPYIYVDPCLPKYN